jgi:4-hydroxy-2-oxoheptanedioate aldolase
MSTNRLNGIIRAWEQGKPALTAFAKLDKQTAIEMSDAPYDGIVFEMEHNPYDVSALGDSLQYMLNRKQIAESGSVAPGVTPLARVPANGVEMNQSFAKQVLDRGVYGVITPHVATVEQAWNAVASCRYARPKNAPLYEPKGVRGDGPATAARYWGLSQAEYSGWRANTTIRKCWMRCARSSKPATSTRSWSAIRTLPPRTTSAC